MDFFDMDFSELFLKKHGEKIFNEISLLIKNEKPEKYNRDYVGDVFKVAFFSYIGLNAGQINKLVKNLYKKSKLNIQDILVSHKDSINYIKKYLQSATDNFM